MDKQRRIENILKVIESGGTSKDVKILNEMGSLEEKVNNLQQRFEEAISLIKEQNKSSYEVAETIAKNLLKDVKGEDGHTPTEEELMSLIEPLIPEAIDGHTPTTDELMNIIDPLFANLKKKYERDIIEKVSKSIPSEDDIISKVSKRLPKEDSIIKSVQDSIKLPSTDELINNLEERIPSLSAPIRDSLELLQGDDRLDKSAIKGLDDDFQLITDTFNKRLNIIATNKPLSEMIDVNISGLKTNQALKWNGVEWVPYTPTDDKAIWGEITGDITDQTDLTTYISEQLATQDTLQEVTDNGATTTKDITAKSFITTGGTSSGFVKGNGSLDTTSYLPTSTASSTYVPYTGATKDVNLGSNSLSLGKRIILENTTSSDTGVIYKGTSRFIHNFSHPTGGTAVPVGYNTFVGLNAGNFTMGSTATVSAQASHNTAIGMSALASNTTGFQNTAIGLNTLCSNTTGAYNTSTGVYSLSFNTTGSHNTALGMGSLSFNTTGIGNTATGRSALRENTTGCYNTASGYASGRYIADGTTPNATSNNSLYLGSNTKPLADGDTNEIVIGYNAIGAGSNTATLGNTDITKTILRGNVGVGTTEPAAPLHVTYPYARTDTTERKAFIISSNDYDTANTLEITAVGHASNQSLRQFNIQTRVANAKTGYLNLQPYGGSVGIGTTTPSQALDIIGNININGTSAYLYDGHNAIKLATKGDTVDYSSTIIGRGAGDNVTDGTTIRQTAVGYSAGCANTGASQTAVGYAAGRGNTGAYQTAVGQLAGCSNTGIYQTALGYLAGFGNAGASQTALGTYAGYLNTGASQTALGYSAGRENTGDSQTAFGYYAGYGNIGIYQTAVGHAAGCANTGASQTAVGYAAGYLNKGANVTAIGHEATRGNQANDVVAIGYQAGKDNVLANQFIVKQANLNATPLIQGDFVTGFVGIGTTSPTSKLDISSDILRLRTAKTPASSSSSANTGDIFWDSDYLYIAVGTNSIKRVPLQSF